MTDSITIRTEQPPDADAIGKVVAAAFQRDAEARLVRLIRASPNFIPELALVGEINGAVVGHVMVSYVTLRGEDQDRRIVSLSPLAVAPEYQRRGVGSKLVRAVVAQADERADPLIVLEGSPIYYGRLGFEPSRPLGIDIDLPSWAPPEAAQVMRLRAYDPSIRGRVVYPPAFNQVSEA